LCFMTRWAAIWFLNWLFNSSLITGSIHAFSGEKMGLGSSIVLRQVLAFAFMFVSTAATLVLESPSVFLLCGCFQL
jgi:hypothetical protein